MSGEITWVALGDSTGVGIGARRGGYAERASRELVARGRPLRLVNLSSSGATAREVLRIASRAPASDLATLAVGINDVRRGAGAEAFAETCAEILRVLETRVTGPILVANLPDVSLAPIVPKPMRPFVASAIDDYNRALAEVVGRHRRGRLVDLHGASRGHLESRDDLFCFDGFHPSDEGYEVWSRILVPELEAALAA
jgi:lysophospholipase L1-like esterase